jgi:hypothetical protein
MSREEGAMPRPFNRATEPPLPTIDGRSIKSGILFFWSSWTTIVVLMNVMDELKALGILPEGWKVASGNYQAISRVTDVYSDPAWLDKTLLFGALLWEGIGAGLFWRAFRLYRSGDRQRLPASYTATSTLLGLFAAFILADEVLHAYKMEGDHREIAMGLLVSLLALQHLPEGGEKER